MIEKDQIFFIYVIALIFSALGAILLLTTPFVWSSYGYYAGEYYGTVYYDEAIGVWTPVYGGLIGFVAFLLIICTIIAILEIMKPEITPDYLLLLGIVISFFAFILVIGGVGVALALGASDPDAGFYGGLLGSLVTGLCFAYIKFKF